MCKYYKKDLEEKFDDIYKVTAYLEHALDADLIYEESYIKLPDDVDPFDINLLNVSEDEYSYGDDYVYTVIGYGEEDNYLKSYRESAEEFVKDRIPADLGDFFAFDSYSHSLYPDVYSITQNVAEYSGYYFINN